MKVQICPHTNTRRLVASGAPGGLFIDASAEDRFCIGSDTLLVEQQGAVGQQRA